MRKTNGLRRQVVWPVHVAVLERRVVRLSGRGWGIGCNASGSTISADRPRLRGESCEIGSERGTCTCTEMLFIDCAAIRLVSGEISRDEKAYGQFASFLTVTIELVTVAAPHPAITSVKLS